MKSWYPSLAIAIFLPLLYLGCSEKPNVQDRGQLPETDIQQRKEFFAEVRKNVNDEKFDWLDTTANELQKSKARFPGGDWKVRKFYEALITPANGDNSPDSEWEELLSKLRKWVDLKPGSMTAQVALAGGLTGYGGKARGSGWASEVTKEGWKVHSERSDQAEKVLMAVEKNRMSCVNWYDAMHFVAKARGWGIDRYNHYFEEAVKLEPLYWDFYQDKAVYLLPRWYGKPGEWEQFAEEASNRIGGKEGNILYSVVCWGIRRYYSSDEFFEKNKVSWERIKKGFVEREKIYGASYRYLNAFCLMAGAAGDRVTTRALLNRIGENWEPDFWTEKKYFDGYKTWAGAK
jgi:hypothetical protein